MRALNHFFEGRFKLESAAEEGHFSSDPLAKQNEFKGGRKRNGCGLPGRAGGSRESGKAAEEKKRLILKTLFKRKE